MGRAVVIEKMGKAISPKISLFMRIIVLFTGGTKAAIKQFVIAATESQIKTQWRSYLSASQLIGYWDKAPPRMKAARKYEI